MHRDGIKTYKLCKSPSPTSHIYKTIFTKLSGDVDILWQLRGLCGCYRDYMAAMGSICHTFFFAKIALRGSFGTDLREGVTMALPSKII